MANYTHEAGSNYPEQLLALSNYEDVNSANTEVLEVIAQIKKYQSDGEYAKAEQLLAEKSDLNLKKYMFGSSDINKLAEELRNTQIKALNVAQQLFYQNSNPEDFASVGDVWISSANL